MNVHTIMFLKLLVCLILGDAFLMASTPKTQDSSTRSDLESRRQALLNDPKQKALFVAYMLSRQADTTVKSGGASTAVPPKGFKDGIWDYWTRFKNYMRSLLGYGS